MDTLNGHRRLRALIVGGALAVALAMPLAVSADTTGGSVIQPAFSRGATITLDAVHLTSKLIATVDISFTCDPLLVYDWETGDVRPRRRLDRSRTLRRDRPGLRSVDRLGIRGRVRRRRRCAMEATSTRCRSRSSHRRRRGSRAPPPRARRSRSPTPRSRPATTRAAEPSPSSSASNAAQRVAENRAPDRVPAKAAGSKERAHPKVRERAADPPTNARARDGAR